MKTRKIPMRTCVVTREKLPKQELLRIVKFDGVVSIDETGKKNGKGCYIKKDLSVLEEARKKHILERALETQIDDSIYEEIKNILS